MSDYMILQNQIRCKTCGDEPFSAYRHDYKTCKCGAVAVDGGMDYLRRAGDLEGYEDLSYSMEKVVIEECKAAIEWAQSTGRNELGTVLAVIRVLKKYGKLKV